MTEVKLTATEFKLLTYLAANSDRVLTHQAILTHVWGFADSHYGKYLRVYIGQLRRKIEQDADNPRIIIIDQGIGHRSEHMIEKLCMISLYFLR